MDDLLRGAAAATDLAKREWSRGARHPGSAPVNPHLRRKVRITTLWALVLWAVVAGIVLSGAITVRDFDVMGRMAPVRAD